MSGSPRRERRNWRGIDLLVPGGGAILAGHLRSGLALLVTFAALANLAIIANLIIPDDFPRWFARGAALAAVAAYLFAQFQRAHLRPLAPPSLSTPIRRAALERAREALAAEDAHAALHALQPLASEAEHDLLVAYRFAQALSLLDDASAALRAWRRVRRLDRHHLYRAESAAQEAALAARVPPAQKE